MGASDQHFGDAIHELWPARYRTVVAIGMPNPERVKRLPVPSF
ncbi:MAG: hypothetical protein ACJAR2_002480 [Ilumatobacter sp.]|jgi:hypothetical protein